MYVKKFEVKKVQCFVVGEIQTVLEGWKSRKMASTLLFREFLLETWSLRLKSNQIIAKSLYNSDSNLCLKLFINISAIKEINS